MSIVPTHGQCIVWGETENEGVHPGVRNPKYRQDGVEKTYNSGQLHSSAKMRPDFKNILPNFATKDTLWENLE
jgi:hypothetical protein